MHNKLKNKCFFISIIIYKKLNWSSQVKTIGNFNSTIILEILEINQPYHSLYYGFSHTLVIFVNKVSAMIIVNRSL